MFLLNKLLEHPKEQGESYFEHFFYAFKCGLLLSIAGIACIIHSFIPFIFKKTATNIARNVLRARCK